jgi:NTP pyrophosphatase (non-canonical NTP hydrolase)
VHDLSVIYELQHEHAVWLRRNFPDQQSYQPILGIVEELGELSHAHLKMEQGIRGDHESLFAEKVDAVGDIFIYLMSYCNANEINLESAIEDTWARVKKRDWINHPNEGGE